MIPVCFCLILKTKVGLALLVKCAEDPRVYPGNMTYFHAQVTLGWTGILRATQMHFFETGSFTSLNKQLQQTCE